MSQDLKGPQPTEKFIAELFCPETGESASYEFLDYFEKDGTYNAITWRDGNFSCDCNRFDFLRPGVKQNPPCSERKVLVRKIYPVANPLNIVYREMADGHK